MSARRPRYTTIRVDVRAPRWQDHDSVLDAVTAELVERIGESLLNYPTNARWETGEREGVLVDIPYVLQGYALAEGYDVVDGPDGEVAS